MIRLFQLFLSSFSPFVLFFVFLIFSASSVWATTPQEQALERKINQQLDAILGPGKARVTVTEKQNRRQIQSRSVQRSHPQVLHERLARETRQGTTRQSRETIYGYDQAEQLISSTSESPAQKSVSVIYQPPTQSEDSENPDPPVDQDLISGIVRTLAQIDETKGDQLNVRAVKMDTSLYERLKAEMEKSRQGTPWWVWGLCALLGLSLGLGMGAFITRRRYRSQPLTYPAVEAYAVNSGVSELRQD
ncbi:hypothetical protein COW36_11780 [bacterium (Candidatus Blackallbacteria) CG17_big_fil_post_rev_8_21_14_2_50_48_46]|uniref:Flagellar M-ring C-terminal domain-containing protein n=1 Tax=bacterium (Candidatus Blackallbacteria) CG17_big_fil_post_rev_8_21_14_2_50_48_46 TaxID=2014261 RepID=A0A2M7G3J0_9BACT|nr:MAG: hypothetical protein COW64_03485 [bacterium (Candidatus Blackallbacteria) CG18_big_fil_WC_8_21_14_2_50_49_26]PIW16443.1 MAG: hypothetical protein COW36_11780 [bacterium (Candidatus Blackallbacteria) CG17_big_fil_post_rev_8_21_14_2_50_48_46]PIW45951.1 MAG: hypothetical protein COW20_17045 [bacterium (Candidatus Blackallbacteria) CG13_big_fil_rev_8_21_14_2_50_49_14]